MSLLSDEFFMLNAPERNCLTSKFVFGSATLIKSPVSKLHWSGQAWKTPGLLLSVIELCQEKNWLDEVMSMLFITYPEEINYYLYRITWNFQQMPFFKQGFMILKTGVRMIQIIINMDLYFT